MAAECRSVVKACLAQFVLLDVCGNPVTGASSKLTTKGFISVGATAQVETGEDFKKKNACGELMINDKDDDLFSWYDLEMTFLQIDAEGLPLIASNARSLTDGAGNTKGFAVGEEIVTAPFSLELWTKVTPQTCAVDGDPEWYYFAFPHVVNGLVGDWTFEDATLDMVVKARTHGAGALWGVGPSHVLDVSDPAITTDHMVGFITDTQPPEPVCGLQAFAG